MNARQAASLTALGLVLFAACTKPERGFAERQRLPELALQGGFDANGNGRIDNEEMGPLSLRAVIDAPAAEPARWLLVHVVFAWCQFCATETDVEASWVKASRGRVRAVQVLVENVEGRAPTQADLWRWIDRGHAQPQSTVPAAIDASGLFRAGIQEPSFLLLDVRGELRIVGREVGPGGLAKLRARATSLP
ncbi:MAG: hypothetical protein HOO96_23335 [Polyangiaceae bacterium]|nr:hypothetical protein [Polyangiaceae bacterium]